MNNYIVFHSHDDMSLLDSCTKYEMYIQRAKELGMNAFAISNHGNFWFEPCRENSFVEIRNNLIPNRRILMVV